VADLIALINLMERRSAATVEPVATAILWNGMENCHRLLLLLLLPALVRSSPFIS